jgi:hypothetical protein
MIDLIILSEATINNLPGYKFHGLIGNKKGFDYGEWQLAFNIWI